MKTLIYLFLIFFSWWGFFIFAIIDFSHLIPDKWYTAIPCFIAAVIWAFAGRDYAERWRKKNNY